VTRPDPDQLLAHVEAEEARARRGRLRIFFGASAGVGKTYAMLEAAQTMRHSGTDVAVGYVEPHGRIETERLMDGLERLPTLAVRYRGIVRQELDLDAALRRRPAILLVDELAHSNVVGGEPPPRHPKRWQDVEELLRAGINVWTTVNVQHLESLNDAVFELTNVRVRETFPDRILDEADQVVLVDLTPEELQERLQAGKVYPRERAEAALQNFFRHENLASLRELALREVAEDVEARRRPRILDPLGEKPVAERILALITPQARSQRLMRRAWRSAQRLSADMDVLWVRRPEVKLTDEQRAQLAELRRLGIVLGAHFLEEESDDFVEAVRAVAADRGTTYVFLGTPDSRRREEVLKSSLVMRLVRALPGVDIRIVADPTRREELTQGARTARDHRGFG
jgi:two-component system sensor histidine kinase KdpD